MIRAAVDRLLHGFLNEQQRMRPYLPELSLFTGMLHDMFNAGGKRIRPLLCVTGWCAITEQLPTTAVFRAAASLELFHAFALIHDDIMDHSDTRRGRPSAHRILAAGHTHHADAAALGSNAAILLGDLALGWSYEILQDLDTAPEQIARILPLFDALRVETLVGQYLDLAAARNPASDTGTAWRIVRYKTAKYTIERPLHIGAGLAAATDPQLRVLSAYALPLGEAFQLRDDLLGVYGNCAATGKSRLDDLREGKHTVLYAIARERATVPQQQCLTRYFGDPCLTDSQAEQLRDVLTATGARSAVERSIAEKTAQALDALDTSDFQPVGLQGLRALAHTAAKRTG
ncbi:polyprenyl synthetase family protein [Streptomyces sp. WP-1]|uniref:polyprenyl synthetase family protein n=1 Tax=Streptomyces sp. WP-1 TaxID=3041497 RepID=UPI002648E7FE|nr:polyprenyl synthetase family protein [Streptomyces sp. WP-1]WKE67548.1 polyprenyl synthetase family protein [Streptomyces sp. WP-1]